jgi:hypothetical protein
MLFETLNRASAVRAIYLTSAFPLLLAFELYFRGSRNTPSPHLQCSLVYDVLAIGRHQRAIAMLPFLSSSDPRRGDYCCGGRIHNRHACRPAPRNTASLNFTRPGLWIPTSRRQTLRRGRCQTQRLRSTKWAKGVSIACVAFLSLPLLLNLDNVFLRKVFLQFAPNPTDGG